MKDRFYEMAKNAILSEIETNDIQKTLDKLQNDSAKEKAYQILERLTYDYFQE